jgi:hypothetical protein
MGNGPVLAKNTAEVAVREKNGAGAASANQRNLFAEMWLGNINHDFGRGTTEPPITILPISPTLPGTKLAFSEDGVGLLNPSSQFARFFQLRIGWILQLYIA